MGCLLRGALQRACDRAAPRGEHASGTAVARAPSWCDRRACAGVPAGRRSKERARGEWTSSPPGASLPPQPSLSHLASPVLEQDKADHRCAGAERSRRVLSLWSRGATAASENRSATRERASEVHFSLCENRLRATTQPNPTTTPPHPLDTSPPWSR